MNSEKTLLNAEELAKLEQGQALGKDYFYIPVIYYSEQTPSYEETWHSLRFNNDEPPASLMAYASKVPAGKTLWQAVRSDLERDFNYPHDKSFVIESAKSYDTTRNKYGEELTRVLVWVGVYQKFSTDNVHPLGMQLTWHEEGENVFNLVGQYFVKTKNKVNDQASKREIEEVATNNENDVVKIQWGGYYTSEEDGKFGLFRLLDFNSETYHIQLFQERFDHVPSFDEVKDLSPFIWHAPIAVGGLLNQNELKLIGHTALDEEALMGYEEYLRQMGADETVIKEMTERLIGYSNQGPMKVKLSKNGDQVVVTPIE